MPRPAASAARTAGSRPRASHTLPAPTERRRGVQAAAVLAAVVIVACGAKAAANSAAILMYHHVSPAVEPGIYARALTVSPLEFEQQVRWLRERGCVLVTVDRAWSDTLAGVVAPCEVALT